MNPRDKSVVAINKFLSKCKLNNKYSTFVCEAKVYDLYDNVVVTSKCKCNYQYDFGNMESKIIIFWDFNDDIMHHLKLQGYYGVNFQNFIFDDEILIIEDDSNERYIKLEKWCE